MSAPRAEHHEVVVVGAGISGIAATIRLREAGISDVVVLEKADTYGGTWRANTYPGCACDVPSDLYSFSFAPNSDWSRVYGTQPEILAYVDGVARDHGLDEVTRFGVELLDASWDRDHWVLRTSAGELTARFLVAAAGPWNEPKIPDLPGLADFPGEVWHSARWRHDVDLTGRRVAVIGTGASAVQFVPEIQPEVADLHLFQRTAHWVLPKLDHAVPRAERWLKRRAPLVARAIGAVEYAAMELVGTAFHHPRPLMHALEKVGRAHLRAVVRDAQLRAALTPTYLLGCKRILFSNHYLPALTRPNVTVHPTGVDRVEGATVVGSDGSSAEVDAIILGTGFHILDMPVADRVRGADGRTLAEHWDGSPEAHLGTVVAGFPNAFVVLGPSLGTGHTSAFTIAEAQVALIVDAITTARREGWSALAVRPEVQAAYVAQVQDALGSTAYNAAECHSYYIDANGRNSFSWPWSTGELVRRVSRFQPDEYLVTTHETAEVTA
ncbi:NAD(P)/FAD-dependent oxidoreductase [Nocardioides panacisoli]|uniref:flavin-containing monooxygenase n=1 Tax=Nocardioides panacisoli TaxID=627624 RepID=UPI001C62644F|nr:NAD(P)/FAD-dependent oxidoreductase [Nocardioides panacisoli]QYJ03302.1 NAD(P)/FAD-dependent oxidoreductase [Nocardioides panacisoli]